ncbi:MAG: DNA-processing protein DprA [Acidobacteriota bacterium]|nr:DNA-processing protein DprA [Acidobacteriota bacterium]
MSLDPAVWVALALLPGVGPLRFSRLMEAGYPADAIPDLPAARVGVGKRAAAYDHARRSVRRRAAHELRHARRLGIQIIPRDSPRYPTLLKEIHDPPFVLWVRGELPVVGPRVAVVGSRTPTAYGRRVAVALAERLSEREIETVSGGARGIDGLAHQTAVESGGRTVAVTGAGLLRPYPPEHAPLFDRIADRGAIVSEFPLEQEPSAGHFPRRNRLISGLCSVVVVVEAAVRSGSLTTATHALDQGREVLAIPGPITSAKSAGCHRLIRDGAALVESLEDVVEAFPMAGRPLKRCNTNTYPDPALDGLSTDEKSVLGILDDVEPFHVDQIADRVPFGVARLQAALMGLQFRAAVDEPAPGYYLSRPRRDS